MTPNDDFSWKPVRLEFDKGVSHVLLQQHHAAQFIALVGRHMILQQADDSNTNMQYQMGREWIIGNELPGGMRIALQLPGMNLLIIDKDYNWICEIGLEGKTKEQVFELLKQTLLDLHLNVSKFSNELHYTLPAHELDEDVAFSVADQKYIQENIIYRHNAEIVLNKMAGNFEKADPVRIWPHHFDTGSIIPLEYNAKGGVSQSIGMGWAIPDTMINEPYYYLSFWFENPIVDIKELPAPEAGEWIKSGWNGAVLKNSDIVKISSSEGQQEFVELFFESGIKILKDHNNK
ncbi:hypothetical protein ACFLTU_05840 [Bacteroidota bacterium]